MALRMEMREREKKEERTYLWEKRLSADGMSCHVEESCLLCPQFPCLAQLLAVDV